MNYVKAGIFFFICWLVQTTLLWRVWPFEAAPSLLLCAAVGFSWLYNRNYGLVYALVFGLLLDIQTQILFGTSALALVLGCVPAMALRRHFNPENPLPNMLSALLATLVSVFVTWGICHIFGSPAGILLAVRTLPTLLISHAIICFILHISFVRTIIKHGRDRRKRRGGIAYG